MDGERRVAAGAAQEISRPDDAGDGVVDMADDGAVVDEEEIGDGVEAIEGVALVDADGFVAEIAAGGDDGETEFGRRKMMERRIGEHDAEGGIPGAMEGRAEGRPAVGAGRWGPRRKEEALLELGDVGR